MVVDHLVLFEEKQVRRVWNEADQKWYFSVQDVIEILTGSADIKQYVKKLKSRDPELSSNWGTICTLVEMTTADGKKRMRGIAVRDELTDEWKQRGVKEQIEYAILTAEISKATFGMTPKEYRDHKGLAHPGGKVAGNARKELERKSGRRVSTSENFKETPERQRRLRDAQKDDQS